MVRNYSDSSNDGQSSKGGTPWLRLLLLTIAVIILIIVIILLYRYFTYLSHTQPTLQTAPVSASKGVVISGKKAPVSVTGREYTYNLWFNVRDWTSGYGKPKCVLHRSSQDPVSSPDCPSNPSIWFYPMENKMMVRVSTMKSQSEEYDPNVYPEYDVKSLDTSKNRNEQYTIVNPVYNTQNGKTKYLDTTYACDIGNIPIQRWVQVTVTLWNRTLDVYVNGKLVRSCVLPGIPLHDKDALSNIYLGHKNPNYSFNGYLSRVKYYNRAITAQEAMDLYLKGPVPTSFWWSSIKHKIKVQMDIE